MSADTPIAPFTPDTFSPLRSFYLGLPLYFMLSVYVTRPPSFFILALCLSDDVVTQKQEGFVVFYSKALPTSSHFLMRPRVAEQQPIGHVKNQRGGFTSCLYDSSVSSWFEKVPAAKDFQKHLRSDFVGSVLENALLIGAPRARKVKTRTPR